MAIRRYTQLDEDDEQFNSSQVDGVVTEFGFVRRIKEEGIRTDTILDDIDEEKRQRRENFENDVKDKIGAAKDRTGELVGKFISKAKDRINSNNIDNNSNSNTDNSNTAIVDTGNSDVSNNIPDGNSNNDTMDTGDIEVIENEQQDMPVVNDDNVSNKGEVIANIVVKYKIVVIGFIVLLLLFVTVKTLFNSNKNDTGSTKHVDIKYEDNANVVSDDIEDDEIDKVASVKYKRNYSEYESVMSLPEYYDIYREYLAVENDFGKLVENKKFLELVSTSYAEEFAAMVNNAFKCNNMADKDIFRINMEQIANDCSKFDEDSKYNLSYYLVQQRSSYIFGDNDHKAFNCIEGDVINGIALMTDTIGNPKYAERVAGYGGDDLIYDYQKIRLDSYKDGKDDYRKYVDFVGNCEVLGYNVDEVDDYIDDSDFKDVFGEHEDDAVEYNVNLCYHYKFLLSNDCYFEFNVVVADACPFIFGFNIEDNDCIDDWAGDVKVWISNSDKCIEELQRIADYRGLVNNSIFEVGSTYNTVIDDYPYIVKPGVNSYMRDDDEDDSYVDYGDSYSDDEDDYTDYSQNVGLGAPSVITSNDNTGYDEQEQSIIDDDNTVIDEEVTETEEEVEDESILYSVGSAFAMFDIYDSVYDWVVDIIKSPEMKYDKLINGISDDRGNNGYYYLVRTLNESNSIYGNFRPIGRLSEYDTAKDFLKSLTWQDTNVYDIYKIYKSIDKYVKDEDNKKNKDEYKLVSRLYSDIVLANSSSEDYSFSGKFPNYLN